MTTRKYSSRSQQTTLTGTLTSGATSATVVSASALLGGATVSSGETFTVVVDPDTALEEILDVTAVASNTLTITRNIDGSSAQEHSAGAVVRHMAIGRDYREANLHIENTTTAHGLTLANVVKTTDTGTVANGMIANSAVTSAKIADGTIVNADINASAAIDKTKISGTAVTVADTGTVTSTMIADGTIVNADVNSSAQIAYGKLALTNGIVDGDINASADIAWSKIAPSSSVSATELGYLDGVTSAVQTQIDSKLSTSTAVSTYAPLANPALTGTPTAPTATAGTNTTQVATTAFVKTAVDDLIAAAPGALDTLDELAAALGDDPNFATTVTNSIATKLPLSGGTMSGAIAMGGNKITGLGTPTANGDAATKAYADAILVGAPGNLTGPITSVGAVTSVAAQTGSGSTFVMQDTPTLTTPILGVATATSINGTPIPSSKTLVATDSSTYVVPSQTGNTGKYLTTDGTTSSWAEIDTSTAANTIMSIMGAY